MLRGRKRLPVARDARGPIEGAITGMILAHLESHLAGYDDSCGDGGTELGRFSHAATCSARHSHGTSGGLRRGHDRAGADIARPDNSSPEGVRGPTQ